VPAVAGCAGDVPVAVPSPAPEVADACKPLVAAVPDNVLSTKRRDTSPASPLTAAWGDPPIELVCGVATPAEMATAQSQCFEVNGVGWFARQAQNGIVFTTIGRKVYVEVAVPDDYAPEANALTDLSEAIATHNPVVTPCT
jgi:Protein of unknown function (DUF3515)